MKTCGEMRKNFPRHVLSFTYRSARSVPEMAEESEDVVEESL